MRLGVEAMSPDPLKRYAAELVGTAALLTTVVGSGIMGESLAGGNTAIALLANTLATGAILFVLITMFGPASGAHFNPAVTLSFFMTKSLGARDAFIYTIVQIVGAILGVWLAHLMFDTPVIQFSEKMRTGMPQWVSEAVATAGLVGTILVTVRVKIDAVPLSVGLYITAAYWFTASTSFANPAVSVARCLTNTFSGIRPEDVLPFVTAQLLATVLVVWCCRWFMAEHHRS